RSASASTQRSSASSTLSRSKCICGADKEVQEYFVPAFKRRSEEQRTEQQTKQRKGYDRSLHYSTELSFLQDDIRIARALAREQIDKVSIQRMVDEKLSLQRSIHEECISRAPDILVRLRSHTVWEKMAVKLFFTVQGFPTPLVQWYKNETLISTASEPGKYRIESKYGVNSLEIHRAIFSDTATYTAVATNVHGQASTNAAVIVKRYRGDEDPLHSVLLPMHLPMSGAICFTHIDVQFLESFGVTFGVEGETVTLSCSMLITPDISRLQPGAEWYRDDVLVKESKWYQMHFGEGRATLTLTHLNKDDEGLYTLRIVTRGGVNQHSGFLFVADAAAVVAGAPGAPMDVECYDANKDYVIVTWKPPNTASEGPVIGYFVDKCEVGTENWIQCNDAPVKICKYPVTGLFEGRSYMFRVRAVNKAGVSRPSRVSVAVAALEPADLARLQTIHLEGGREIVICQDDLEGEVRIPGPPTNVKAPETSKAYVVLSWDTPVPRGRDPIVYYVEKSMVGSGSWQRVNSQIPVRSPRFAVFDLVEGKSYNFRVIAVNKHGVSEPSEITPPIQAQERLAVPSAPGRILASRNTRTSVVVQFDKPKQEEELIGYYIDSSVVGSNHWDHCNHKPIKYNRFVVHGLTTGEKYIFRVKAVNAVGVSENSQESEAITVKAALRTKEINAGVDEEGNIYLAFNCTEMSDASQFTWGKSYEEIDDELKFKAESIGENSKLYFKNPDKDDLGTYSVSVSDTEGISSSFVMESDELERLMALSHEIRNPTIPLKSELAYEILERGRVRFWLEAQHLTADANYRFVVNDMEVKDSENHKIKFDKSTGIIEMVMDRFTIENEGTYTVQIQDGKAKNQSSLVLIGDAFKALLAEAEFQRKEYIRKQGPHFEEYLYWEVTDECEVVLVCKVANTKKETVFKWIKDDVLADAESLPDLQQGVCKLLIPKMSKKDQGVYKATLKDDRGEDVSTLEITGKVYEDIILGMSRVSGSSASELKIHCTPEGIRFHCSMKYYTEDMKVVWYQRESKIASSEKMRIGGTDDYAWMQICEPTEKDKGKYTFEIFDAKTSYKRTVDLSGQAFDEAYAEFQRLKQAAFAEKNRGKVIGGLPDVVTIMEGKTLNLTCTVFGNPDPEMTWLKNERSIELNDHYKAALEQGKYASLIIKDVSSEDSGKYGITVRNKFGGETVDVTIMVTDKPVKCHHIEENEETFEDRLKGNEESYLPSDCGSGTEGAQLGGSRH
ncbi:hypothetical protein FKM82_011163, partial [Ascaphus truei]